MARKPKVKYKRPYLDSSVFISWVNNETDVGGTDRKAIADDILKAARDGLCQICTSTLTIAEAHKLRNGPRLDEENGTRLLEFFESDFILYVDLERRVAEHAHRLCSEHGIYPCDGVHLASAIKAKCDVLLAWDTRFERVTLPDIAVEHPQFLVGQLSLSGEAATEGDEEVGAAESVAAAGGEGDAAEEDEAAGDEVGGADEGAEDADMREEDLE
jgi:predicted nucleic acid-binding protein